MPLAVFVALLVFIVLTLSPRQRRELGRWSCVALASLRIAAVTGLLLGVSAAAMATDREVVQNSRLLVLVDTAA